MMQKTCNIQLTGSCSKLMFMVHSLERTVVIVLILSFTTSTGMPKRSTESYFRCLGANFNGVDHKKAAILHPLSSWPLIIWRNLHLGAGYIVFWKDTSHNRSPNMGPNKQGSYLCAILRSHSWYFVITLGIFWKDWLMKQICSKSSILLVAAGKWHLLQHHILRWSNELC